MNTSVAAPVLQRHQRQTKRLHGSVDESHHAAPMLQLALLE